MKQLVEEFVQQLRHAIERSEKATVRFPKLKYKDVVLVGMGGSGITASLVQAYVANKLSVPLVVNKSYSLPAFVSADTLFIASSFSGNTEESIAGIRAAMECGATVCFVTSGGEAMRIAQENELPHLLVPAAMKYGRASFGYGLVQLLYVLHYAGLLNEDFKTELEQSIHLLEEQAGSINVQASALASAFKGKLPVVYTSDTFAPVALRLQQQLNQNAKQLCHIGAFPEVSHNEIEGWLNPPQLFEQVVLLLVKSTYDHPRAQLRLELSKKIFAGKVQDVLEIEALGATFLEQVLYLVHIFDWVSVLLADLNEVNPGDTDNIDYLKEELSKV